MEKRTVRNQKVRKKRKLWIKITLSVIALLVIGVGVYAYSLYDNVKETVNAKMHKTVEAINTEKSGLKIEEKEPLNILLMGIDKREHDRGRSDALAVLRLDPQTNKMHMVSIPRDTYAEMVGMGKHDKINHAYAFGGPDMTINTVENLLGIEIDYFVEMNMEGLSDLVDAIGGITVNNELDWYTDWYGEKGFHFKKGELDLNGELTMYYVRMRYQDPTGDFGRTKRQREVIKAIIDKGMSIGSVNKINGILDVLGDNMATNMDFNVMKDLLMNYRSVANNVESYMLQGSGTMMDGIYYYMVPDDEVQKVNSMLEDGKTPL